MNTLLTLQSVLSTLDSLAPRVRAIARELGDDFPDYYDPARDAWARNGGWTEGFWTGILWWLYHFTHDAEWLRLARHYTALLAEQKRDFTDHDLGFLYDHSCLMQVNLVGDGPLAAKPTGQGPLASEQALAAAERLALRFNPHGQFIRAHGPVDAPERAGYAIIDTIMNLHLLFWAARQTGQDRFRQIATATAHTIAREYLRADGSTLQVVWFEPSTGAVERRATLQGYAADSCWSRGQAWAIYGFVQVYRETGEASFLDHARRLADYFLAHMPPGGRAPYDFLDPAAPAVPTDTSAQAIAAAGLLALAELSAGRERSSWLAAAAGLLAPLCDAVAPQHPVPGRSRGLLAGACYFLSRGRGVDSELMFGDFYFVEALMRYRAAQAWS